MTIDRRRHHSRARYAAYQAQITERHLLPLFRRLGVPLERPIIDVGCGTGGCAIALSAALVMPVEGVDILAEDIAAARAAAAEAGVEARFEVLDVVRDPVPAGRYGLILLRDVVEHLPELERCLGKLRPMLDDGGRLYVTFPPWRGPYAGHQHNATGAARLMPWAHALAPGLFLRCLHRWERGREAWLADERQIFANRLSRRGFERAAAAAGWHVRYRQTYFLRPAFMRMGLPTVANGFVGRLPWIGESVTTACEYLLAAER